MIIKRVSLLNYNIEEPVFCLEMREMVRNNEEVTLLQEVVSSSRFFKASTELAELAAKIIKASEGKRYIIHFGV